MKWKGAFGFSFCANNLGGRLGGVRLSQMRQRGLGDSQGRTMPFRSMGEGRRKASGNHLEEYVSISRERLLYRWWQELERRRVWRKTIIVQAKLNRGATSLWYKSGNRQEVLGSRAHAGSGHLWNWKAGSKDGCRMQLDFGLGSREEILM